MPGSVHSGSASRDDCGRTFPGKLSVSSFLDRFPHYAWTTAVSPLRFRWVKGVCVIKCNLPLALFAEWPGSFTCHCGNTGLEHTRNKSQNRNLTLEKKILPLLLPGFEHATFPSRVRRSNQQDIPALLVHYEDTARTQSTLEKGNLLVKGQDNWKRS